jgi:hypothetical protein
MLPLLTPRTLGTSLNTDATRERCIREMVYKTHPTTRARTPTLEVSLSSSLPPTGGCCPPQRNTRRNTNENYENEFNLVPTLSLCP